MTDEHRPKPLAESERVERVQDAAVVFTPCHGRRVFFPFDKAVPEVVLNVVCPADGRELLVELIPDNQVEGGLRPKWVDPQAPEER